MPTFFSSGDTEEADHEGKEFHNSGVTIIRVKGGKVVAIKEYIFDADSLEKAWGKK